MRGYRMAGRESRVSDELRHFPTSSIELFADMLSLDTIFVFHRIGMTLIQERNVQTNRHDIQHIHMGLHTKTKRARARGYHLAMIANFYHQGASQ
jgi:hypothetical protein